jgi:hypothetical protein
MAWPRASWVLLNDAVIAGSVFERQYGATRLIASAVMFTDEKFVVNNFPVLAAARMSFS